MDEESVHRKVFLHHASGAKQDEVAASQLPQLVSCCGVALTDAEARALVLRRRGSGPLRLAEFLEIMAHIEPDPATCRAEMVQALTELNRLRGHDSDAFISMNDLVAALKVKMPASEVRGVASAIAESGVKRNGRDDVSIEDFVKTVLLL